jgi:GntR family transcriptional repressor for pyruvate dehydrogenase complex
LHDTSDDDPPRRPRWRFHPIGGPRAHEEVVDQITFAIRSGAFARGERLPHVDDLARQMGVSKPTIGEAIKVLMSAGVLAAQRGVNGGLTVLKDVVPNKIMALASAMPKAPLQAIVEARRPIELQLAVLAAERATESDFKAMERSIEQLRHYARRDRALRIHYDHLFHYAMAQAADSPVLSLYQHQILEQLYIEMKTYFATYEDVGRVIALHEDTLEALRTRDREIVTMAIDRHLRPLEDHVAAILTRPKPRRRSSRAEARPQSRATGRSPA